MDDDYDIYADLDESQIGRNEEEEFGDEQDQLELEALKPSAPSPVPLKEEIRCDTETQKIEVSNEEVEELKKIIFILKRNLSLLLETAKTELNRKNKEIHSLRKQIDDQVFKRNKNIKIVSTCEKFSQTAEFFQSFECLGKEKYQNTVNSEMSKQTSNSRNVNKRRRSRSRERKRSRSYSPPKRIRLEQKKSKSKYSESKSDRGNKRSEYRPFSAFSRENYDKKTVKSPKKSDRKRSTRKSKTPKKRKHSDSFELKNLELEISNIEKTLSPLKDHEVSESRSEKAAEEFNRGTVEDKDVEESSSSGEKKENQENIASIEIVESKKGTEADSTKIQEPNLEKHIGEVNDEAEKSSEDKDGNQENDASTETTESSKDTEPSEKENFPKIEESPLNVSSEILNTEKEIEIVQEEFETENEETAVTPEKTASPTLQQEAFESEPLNLSRELVIKEDETKEVPVPAPLNLEEILPVAKKVSEVPKIYMQNLDLFDDQLNSSSENLKIVCDTDPEEVEVLDEDKGSSEKGCDDLKTSILIKETSKSNDLVASSALATKLLSENHYSNSLECPETLQNSPKLEGNSESTDYNLFLEKLERDYAQPIKPLTSHPKLSPKFSVFDIINQKSIAKFKIPKLRRNSELKEHNERMTVQSKEEFTVPEKDRLKAVKRCEENLRPKDRNYKNPFRHFREVTKEKDAKKDKRLENYFIDNKTSEIRDLFEDPNRKKHKSEVEKAKTPKLFTELEDGELSDTLDGAGDSVKVRSIVVKVAKKPESSEENKKVFGSQEKMELEGEKVKNGAKSSDLEEGELSDSCDINMKEVKRSEKNVKRQRIIKDSREEKSRTERRKVEPKSKTKKIEYGRQRREAIEKRRREIEISRERDEFEKREKEKERQRKEEAERQKRREEEIERHKKEQEIERERKEKIEQQLKEREAERQRRDEEIARKIRESEAERDRKKTEAENEKQKKEETERLRKDNEAEKRRKEEKIQRERKVSESERKEKRKEKEEKIEKKTERKSEESEASRHRKEERTEKEKNSEIVGTNKSIHPSRKRKQTEKMLDFKKSKKEVKKARKSDDKEFFEALEIDYKPSEKQAKESFNHLNSPESIIEENSNLTISTKSKKATELKKKSPEAEKLEVKNLNCEENNNLLSPESSKKLKDEVEVANVLKKKLPQDPENINLQEVPEKSPKEASVKIKTKQALKESELKIGDSSEKTESARKSRKDSKETHKVNLKNKSSEKSRKKIRSKVPDSSEIWRKTIEEILNSPNENYSSEETSAHKESGILIPKESSEDSKVNIDLKDVSQKLSEKLRKKIDAGESEVQVASEPEVKALDTHENLKKSATEESPLEKCEVAMEEPENNSEIFMEKMQELAKLREKLMKTEKLEVPEIDSVKKSEITEEKIKESMKVPGQLEETIKVPEKIEESVKVTEKREESRTDPEKSTDNMLEADINNKPALKHETIQENGLESHYDIGETETTAQSTSSQNRTSAAAQSSNQDASTSNHLDSTLDTSKPNDSSLNSSADVWIWNTRDSIYRREIIDGEVVFNITRKRKKKSKKSKMDPQVQVAEIA